MPKIAVVGTTTWGSTLGIILAGKGSWVRLWARTEEEAALLNQARQNSISLPGVAFPHRMSVTSNMAEALDGVSLVILAVPAQSLRHNTKAVAGHLKPSMLIVSAAKGLEETSGKRMSQVIAEEVTPDLHANICVLSGPNIAKEIAQGLPAAAVVAAQDMAVAEQAQNVLATHNYRVYTSNDIVGVELAGALKNIIALGAGMVEGLGYGDNTKAAIMTRGLAEITRLGVALGANPLTFAGLAGVGDVIVTCTSPLSRNHHVGVELGRGRSLSQIMSSMRDVAEGIGTTAPACQLAHKLGLEMPVTRGIYRVLFDRADPRQVATELLRRPAGKELARIED